MLELKDSCFTIQKDGEDLNLIDKVSIEVPRGPSSSSMYKEFDWFIISDLVGGGNGGGGGPSHVM